MLHFQQKSRVIITCNKRLAPLVQSEVETLGFKPVNVGQTYIELSASLDDCMVLNLHLRCASQVLYSLKRFVANSPVDVYNAVHQIPWEKFIAADGYFSITSNVQHPTVNNTLFANVKVKDAIADRMRDKTGGRPDSGPSLDKTVIHLFWRDEQAELFLDTSGETLAKHGYRKIPGKAPMLEALAAATVLASRWNRQSPFVNPMCGSGTLAIEAALVATQTYPGWFRHNYAFMHVLGYNAATYQAARTAMEARQKNVAGLQIIATDLSEDAVQVTKTNAAAAGVEKYLATQVCDFAHTPVPENQQGVVFFNPEYGERLGDEAKLQETYSRIGDFLKQRCNGYMGYIFTGNLELAKKIGLKAKRRIEFYNSKIDCRLLEYELYRGTRQNT